MNEEFRFDVWSQGEGVRRDQRVVLGDESLRIGELEVAHHEVLWKARRADLLMLFTRQTTLALQGSSEPLNQLDRSLVRRLHPGSNRTHYLRSVAGEVLLFAAAGAARGRIEGSPVTGLHVIVVTRAALHLFSTDSRRSMSFPVEQCRIRSGSGEDATRDTVLLRRDDDVLELLYLFPEERTTLVEAAR